MTHFNTKVGGPSPSTPGWPVADSVVPSIGALLGDPAAGAAGDERALLIARDPEPLSPRNQGWC